MLRIVCVLSLFSGVVLGETFEGNLRVLARSLEKCGRTDDFATCLRVKAVTLIDKALNSETPVVINDFLTLAPDMSSLENTTSVSEPELLAQLPADPAKKDSELDDMISDKVSRFLHSRSLQFTIPADLNEGRGKKKKDKGGMMMMAGLAMGAMMVQMAMGKIGLIAGKALIVGKMALLLSVIIGLKKLMSSGGGESHPQVAVVYATEGHGGGWGRSIEEKEVNERHDLAYKAYATAQARSQQ